MYLLRATPGETRKIKYYLLRLIYILLAGD